MSLPIQILGLGANGLESLTSEARDSLRAATFIAGGARHLALVAAQGVETLTLTNNMNELVARLRDRGPTERCVVLASGDPLCFGIGATLRARLGPDQLAIKPNLSSLQLAFARSAHSWHDATIASIHGRPLAAALLPLLGRSKIGLFTQDGESPAQVAGFFLERGLHDYQAWVCEDLGSTTEQVSAYELRELPGRAFRDLNFLILIRKAPLLARPTVPTDDQFARPASGPVLLTHQDVRAVALSRFHDLPSGPVWDIGAGLGGLSIGLANQFPGAEVIAVERSPAQLGYLRENRARFEAWNLRIVPGTAPEMLIDEPAPAGIFLGGSGRQLDAILDLVIRRLLPGGVFVANFVGLENLAGTLDRLRLEAWKPGLTQLQVSPSHELAGLTTFVPQRPVWIVHVRKPA